MKIHLTRYALDKNGIEQEDGIKLYQFIIMVVSCILFTLFLIWTSGEIRQLPPETLKTVRMIALFVSGTVVILLSAILFFALKNSDMPQRLNVISNTDESIIKAVPDAISGIFENRFEIETNDPTQKTGKLTFLLAKNNEAKLLEIKSALTKHNIGFS